MDFGFDRDSVDKTPKSSNKIEESLEFGFDRDSSQTSAIHNSIKSKKSKLLKIEESVEFGLDRDSSQASVIKVPVKSLAKTTNDQSDAQVDDMDSDIDRGDTDPASSVNDRGTSLNGLTDYVMGNKSRLGNSIRSKISNNLGKSILSNNVVSD